MTSPTRASRFRVDGEAAAAIAWALAMWVLIDAGLVQGWAHPVGKLGFQITRFSVGLVAPTSPSGGLIKNPPKP
jgi:hypothetical protein